MHSRKPGVGKHPFPRRLMFPAHLNQRNVYSAVKQIFAIRFMACGKANIHNPSLQLCWQGLASLLAHERSRFAICQWELSTPTDISIPPHPPLSAPRTWSGGMLICVQTSSQHTSIIVKKAQAIKPELLMETIFFINKILSFAIGGNPLPLGGWRSLVNCYPICYNSRSSS